MGTGDARTQAQGSALGVPTRTFEHVSWSRLAHKTDKQLPVFLIRAALGAMVIDSFVWVLGCFQSWSWYGHRQGPRFLP